MPSSGPGGLRKELRPYSTCQFLHSGAPLRCGTSLSPPWSKHLDQRETSRLLLVCGPSGGQGSCHCGHNGHITPCQEQPYPTPRRLTQRGRGQEEDNVRSEHLYSGDTPRRSPAPAGESQSALPRRSTHRGPRSAFGRLLARVQHLSGAPVLPAIRTLRGRGGRAVPPSRSRWR